MEVTQINFPFFFTLYNTFVQGESVNWAILKMSRTVNVFIYLVLTHVNTLYI
jgi:hypothetical protein